MRGARATFASLRNANFRLYFVAQIGSNIGAWIQITAENWLVLELTDSGLALGITNALQFGPLVFLGLYGGVVADRFDRRRLLLVTQSLLALQAVALGLLVAMDLIELWMIWLAALGLGLTLAVDKPALLGFVKDLVGDADLPNATALNNAVISAGRMVGPAVSGLLIASFGMAPSFFINAISFAGVILVLSLLDVARLHTTDPVGREPGQVREALSYIRRHDVLLPTVIVMSVVFVAAYNFQVMAPLLAFRILGGSSELYGAVMSTLGLGAVTGSLLIASRLKPGVPMVAVGCGMVGLAYGWLALPLGVWATLAGMYILGVTCGFFSVTVTSTLQVHVRDDMRGRVMSTYSIGILGSALIGAPLAGFLADQAGVDLTLTTVAAACVLVSLTTLFLWRRHRRSGSG